MYVFLWDELCSLCVFILEARTTDIFWKKNIEYECNQNQLYLEREREEIER